MESKVISRNQYHQLVGLLTVAQQGVSHLYAVETAAGNVLGLEKNDQVMDAIWSGDEPVAKTSELLKSLDIMVEDGHAAPASSEGS